MPSGDMRPSDDSARLSATDRPSTRPCALRSSGTNARPAAIASAGRAMPTRLAVDVDRAGDAGARDAEQRRQRGGAARAHRTRERDDLARAHGEAADRRRRVRPASDGCVHRRCCDLEHRRRRRRPRRSRAARGRRRAPCRSSAARSSSVGRRSIADELAVAHHGDAIAQRGDLVEPVRDVDERRARGAALADEREQALDLGRR